MSNRLLRVALTISVSLSALLVPSLALSPMAINRVAAAPPDTTTSAGWGGGLYNNGTLTVSDGLHDSSPAEVIITVQPGNDPTPPKVIATEPISRVHKVPAYLTPTASGGPYLPAIWLQFSKPISATTITTQTLYVHSGFERTDRTIARYTNNSFAKNRLKKVGFCGRVW